jgi:transposase
MKTNNSFNTSEVRAEQVANAKYEAIYLGVDLHKVSISVARIIDHSTPQAAQRFTWETFWRFIEKQKSLAKQVYVVYEAGAFGFWVCRQLKSMGVECFVAHPEKLDPRHKRVQTDRLDSGHLVDKLQRYVLGNRKAMVAVYVPTEQEEQQRVEARHRRKLHQQVQSLMARGRGLLLSQGIFQTQLWWRESLWKQLQPKLSVQLATVLQDLRALIEQCQKLLKPVEQKLRDCAPKELPRGFGRLTFALLLREVGNYKRFENRRNIGGFTGLCGGVSSSGPYHLDLSINKAGNVSPGVNLLVAITRRVAEARQLRAREDDAHVRRERGVLRGGVVHEAAAARRDVALVEGRLRVLEEQRVHDEQPPADRRVADQPIHHPGGALPTPRGYRAGALHGGGVRPHA